MMEFIRFLPVLLPIVGLFGFYVLVSRLLPEQKLAERQLAVSMLFSVCMLYTVHYPQSVLSVPILDVRGTILALAYLLGGWRVGLVTLLTGLICTWLAGGVGVAAGTAGLMLNFSGCMALEWFSRGRSQAEERWLLPSLFAVCAAMSEMLSLLLIFPVELGRQLFIEKAALLGGVQLFTFAVIWIFVETERSQQRLEQTIQCERESFVRNLALEHSRFSVLFEEAAIGITLVAPDGRMLKVNDRFVEIMKRPRDELESLTFQQITWADDLAGDLQLVQRLLNDELKTYRLEKRYIRGDGQLIWANLTASLVRQQDGTPDYFISFVEDISEQKAYQQQISKMAFRDALTDLPNRRLFIDRLRYAMARSRRSEQYGALLMLDLDGFKTLNDTQGHDVGDAFLQCVAKRIRDGVAAQDTVARLGGDEFVVILENLGAQEPLAAAKVEDIAEQLKSAIAMPYQHESVLGSMPFQTTASIGACLFIGNDETLDELLKHVDLALYDAKDAGRNGLRFYNAEMQYALETRSIIQGALFVALEHGQLMIYAQPQVDVQGHVVGAELLLRWQHPKVGWVSPAQFIPLAEETGAIASIGRWVMLEACRTLARWAHLPGYEALTLAINVSICQFRQVTFVQEVMDALEQTGAPPHALKLEFTESIVIDDIEDTIAKMQSLRALGIRFSMDDFGTGYSSLSCLKRLPLDQLKIDQSFVRDITTDPDDAAIVAAILSMCHSLKLEVVAEGVETVQQQLFLQQHGCVFFQGYLFGRPVPLAELERLHRLSLLG